MKPKRRLVSFVLLAGAVLVAACAGATHAAASETLRAPQRLSQTGLYAGPGASRIDPRNLPYTPQYPLWSDGAGKSRWTYLPPGKKIDAHDTDAWDFPVGTKFWKEFAFAGRKVETRMLWKASSAGWVFATYVWRPDQSDADLAPEGGIADFVEIAPDKRHSIPGINDCRACHDSRRTEILGFNALQLSTDRDPNALHAEPLTPDMVTLRTLVEGHRLSPERRDLLENPPRIPSQNPRTRTVLGYLAVNCGACHNAENPIAGLGMLLQHTAGARDVEHEPALVTALAIASRYEIPGTQPGQTQRLAPGAPERSAILYRMSSRRPASQMPPLGTQLVDAEAIALVRRWITEDLAAAATAP